MASLDFTALELSSENLTSVQRDPPQFLYCTAENVLQTPFLGELKNSNTAIHKAVSAIVVDESHTVESWTGKRLEEKASCVVVILHELEILCAIKTRNF